MHLPGQVLPPAEPVVECPPAVMECPPVYVDPCDPCNPCYTGEYVYLEPGAAYVAPGPAIPAFPPTVAPPPVAQQPTQELPGWFDVLPSGPNAISPDFGLPSGPVVSDPVPNPMVVPVVHNELGWDQLTDVVSTYFPISREQPVQLNDGILTEGFIETPPQVGATLLEPHRKDSAGSFNRWQATLQTIRRRAYLRVMPTAQGWAIENRVFKEVEDLPYPESASAGLASLRSDNSLPSQRLPEVDPTRESEHWIPLGRDEALEQKMLKEIYTRLTTGK